MALRALYVLLCGALGSENAEPSADNSTVKEGNLQNDSSNRRG